MLVNYGSREYYMPSGLTFRKRFNLVNREANSFIPLALDLQQKVFAIIWPKPQPIPGYGGAKSTSL